MVLFIKKISRAGRRVVLIPLILKDYFIFLKKNKGSNSKSHFFDLIPRVFDNSSFTPFDRHYVYHPAWAARCVKKINPSCHVDIASTLHFSTIISAFIPTKFYDYRPPSLSLDNLKVEKIDLTKLSFEENSIESLSCMHTVEHVGLGRYGEPIDPTADMKAIAELKRVVARGGSLLFVVPVGGSKVYFNSHRVYSYEHIISCFVGFQLKEFSLISNLDDAKGIIYNATKEQVDREKYGCGCFWFIKEKE